MEKLLEKGWSNLPSDLLRLVADLLGLPELLSFRGVCNSWRAASTSASAQIQSQPNHKPWFILYGQEDGGCTLVTDSEKKYGITIPELCGATCISSYMGWLLLLSEESSSLFLFCPFSRARMNLPSLPQQEFSSSDHVVAAFSSPPSSQDCVICIANQMKNRLEGLYILRRGDKEWSKHQAESSPGKIIIATYEDKLFYFIDNADGLVTFSVKSKTIEETLVKWVSGQKKHPGLLPFYGTKDYFLRERIQEKLGLGDGVSVSTCGTVKAGDDMDTVVPYESINFSAYESGSQQLKGVWIQPRFHQIESNQSW